MDRAITDEILEELSSAMERVEAQSSAVLEFVRDKGMGKEDELAPYLERANAASSVRWRATRVRLAGLLSGLEKSERQAKDRPTDEEQKSEAAKGSEPPLPEDEKKTAQPLGAGAARDKQEPSKRRHPADADSGDASEIRTGKSRPEGQKQGEKATPASAEQPPEKQKRPDVA